MAAILLMAVASAQPGGNCKTCFPAQSGQSGKYLQTTGSSLVWSAIGVSDSVPWRTGNGNIYMANPNLNVGIGTNNPVGKLTVVDTAHNLTWGYIYNPLLRDNAYGNLTIDGPRISGYLNQNPTGTDKFQGMFIVDTTTGVGAQIFLNYDGISNSPVAMLSYDNPSDTSENIRITVNEGGFTVLNSLNYDQFFKVDGAGQMRYYKNPVNGGVLTSDASGNANWRVGVTNGATPPVSTPSYIGQLYVDTGTEKLYFAVGTSSSADWKPAN